MAEEDPFTKVYKRLWDMVVAFPGFAEDVRVGNRIDFAGNARDPEKEVVRPADTPEVMIAPQAGEANLCSTSSESVVTKDIIFIVKTGDKRVNWTHNQMQWYIIRALTKWKADGGLSQLTWSGHSFVEDANITTISEGLTDEQINQNIEGWSSVITIQVRMRFASVLLRG